MSAGPRPHKRLPPPHLQYRVIKERDGHKSTQRSTQKGQAQAEVCREMFDAYSKAHPKAQVSAHGHHLSMLGMSIAWAWHEHHLLEHELSFDLGTSGMSMVRACQA